ncbi:unnamed protein product [Cylindrotheca closterium]|uniref:Uncharacterized protein n=1 Tax=Cylindrotheca closterium TaxID=2856 RepID=A0AAD2JI77_9STRA|nr:unnamed protein product [Cylindrotheca closterium]
MIFSMIYASRSEENERIQLPIDTNSTLASNIRNIWHFPSKQAICIELQNNTRCRRPAFLGRLSGQSLALLDWKNQNDERFGPFKRCGSYGGQWLSNGTYFLEVITLFCEDFGINSLTKSQNESEWLSIDFKHKCMEDPNYNRVTHGADSHIQIRQQVIPPSHYVPRGRWVLPTAESPPKPIHYRYQPIGCRENPKTARCENATDVYRLRAYSYEWEDNAGEVWREQVQNVKSGSRSFPTVCFVGYSHSRITKESFVRLGLPKQYAIHVKVKWPEDITAALFNQSYVEQGCKVYIIAAAQWPGSRIDRFPYLFDRFYAVMKQIVETATSVFAGRDDDVRVYMRSIHEIPLGDFTGSCPIVDWRSPIVMNGYSYLVEKAVREVQEKNDTSNRLIRYLDTSFLVSPMWDSATDWVHLPFQVSDEEALYMASVVSNNLLDYR